MKDPVDIKLGGSLRRLRKQRGFSVARLGLELGMSPQQIRKYEDGVNRVSASTLFRLSQILALDVAEFFRDIPNRQVGAAKEPPSPSAADIDLCGIEDPEVRRHLKGLLRALDKS